MEHVCFAAPQISLRRFRLGTR